MGPLRLAMLAVMLVATEARAGLADCWSDIVAEASGRFGVPEAWIRQVMIAESGGRTRLHGRPIESPAGAMGLMQLMPGTWHDLREAHRLGPDPHDPHDNIMAGTAYLRAMYDRFGYPGLFAAYHAGPARYAEHLATGRSLPRETVLYVAGLTGTDRQASPWRPLPRSSPIFFAEPSAGADAAQRAEGRSNGDARPGARSLFVRLSTTP